MLRFFTRARKNSFAYTDLGWVCAYFKDRRILKHYGKKLCSEQMNPFPIFKKRNSRFGDESKVSSQVSQCECLIWSFRRARLSRDNSKGGDSIASLSDPSSTRASSSSTNCFPQTLPFLPHRYKFHGKTCLQLGFSAISYGIVLILLRLAKWSTRSSSCIMTIVYPYIYTPSNQF